MEFSQILGFLKIVNESSPSKNERSMAAITILAPNLPSILFLLFAMSYIAEKLSSQDLFSRTETTIRRELVAVVLLATFPAIFYPNPNIIAILGLVLVNSLFMFELYSSGVSDFSEVVSIVEMYKGREALEEEADQLAKNQRLCGVMLNVSIKLLLLSVFLRCLTILVDEESIKLATGVVFLVNSVPLALITGWISYTVFYILHEMYSGEI